MRNTKQAGPIGTAFIAITLTVIGFIVLFYFGWPKYQMAKKSLEWPKTSGVILSSNVSSTIKKEKNKSVKMYSVNISYKYTVGTESFTSHDLYLGSNDSSSSDRSDAYKTIKKYPIGKKVDVFYSPETPDIGILEPGVKFEHYLILLVGGVFFIVGAMLLVGTVFKLFVLTSVVGLSVGSAISKSSKKSKKQLKENKEGELINLDDELSSMNELSEASITPIDEPWKYKWMIVGGKKEWGPYSYDKVIEYLEKNKITHKHKCYSPSGGGKVVIGQIANKQKAS